MSRRLIIMRHAQAEQNAVTTDFDRALTAQGRAQATAVGGRLESAGLAPDHVLCSAANRTRQTWELVARGLSTDPTVAYETDLYSAAPDTAFELVNQVDADVRTLLLIGHNPTMAQLVAAFSGGSGHPHFPPASVAVVDVEADWLYTAPGTGSARILERP
ncbi:SixA phosphatase family protein [Nocardiopsis ansamitocini]|uniref:Phosphohistidine phosphatase n=1 Tax=Nocardiopsis ansamitocini TaxID=1670832 RepID=A0A9W6P575_9ACTN|nr:histidine phosphatase family protein [Nocardiopsis ansamitocini]GLU47228.1 phosphohistidine phosphatase [Nocardiopsis ansamitocini]